jgi:hypothetical protein
LAVVRKIFNHELTKSLKMDKILVDKSVLEQALMALTWMSDCYVGDDDDSGECASCHERSYMPHAPTCKKQNAINTLQSVLAQQVADPTDPGHDVDVLREHVRHLERRVRELHALAQQDQEPVAWRTFDGEGGWDYRTYADNEHYRDNYIKRNGEKYASWVEPLYTYFVARKSLPL